MQSQSIVNQSSPEKNVPRVGVGVIVVKDNNVLMGCKKNSQGQDFWAFHGGHYECFFYDRLADFGAFLFKAIKP